MSGVGVMELLLVMIFALISLLIPVATLVTVLLIYGKVNRIEQSLMIGDYLPGQESLK